MQHDVKVLTAQYTVTLVMGKALNKTQFQESLLKAY